MQTVASIANRLDMSAEDAVEKLRYLFYDVEGVDTPIDDDLIDILLDLDDEPDSIESLREEREKEQEKERKAAEKRKAAAKKAAAKKKASTAKKKAATKKKPAAKKKKAAAKKKKATAKKKPAAKKKTATAEVLPDEPETDAPEKPTAEILPEGYETPAEAAESAKAELLSDAAQEAPAEEVPEVKPEAAEAGVPSDLPPERAAVEEVVGEPATTDEEEPEGVKKATSQPDPKVVADVIRKAHERKARGTGKKRGRGSVEDKEEDIASHVGSTRAASTPPRPVAPSGPRKTGKTARKRQKKIEKARREEEMRRSAAAAIKEYQSGAMDAGPKKRKKKKGDSSELEAVETEARKVIQVEEGMTVEELAETMEVDPTDLILELMELEMMVTKNQSLAMDVIRKLAEPRGFEVESVIPEEEEIMAEEPDDPADLHPRAPVITVMGHVDHGKTSLLDQVRKASVAAGEAGGITQHIAAYQVALPSGSAVFLDTPGHEAFTAMRARGAQVTDVVVLVVAADDGIMPQTREAIGHAQAAEVPIVVAINKCDKPDAQPDRIRQELTEFGLVDEAWGGKTIMRNISALTGEGIEELMELLVLETELLELKANPNKKARGTVVESEITRGQGPVAWVLIESGTLKVGDSFIAGETYGKVRAMQDGKGNNVDEAGPSTAIVVLGFSGPATAGDKFITVESERVARSIAEKRQARSRSKTGPAVQHVTLEDFHKSLMAGETNELLVLVKGDVQGSVDVLNSTLPGLGNDEVRVKVVHSGVGAINESDVLLASASNAVVLGFHVEPTTKAQQLAESEGVEIKTYKVIYEMTEDLRKSLEGLLEPEEHEVVIGHAEIRQVFKSSSMGNIAGCMVLDGEVTRDAKARLKRDDEVVWEGAIGTLRREKDTVSAVQTGFECGITLAGFGDIQEGDIIEAYKLESVAKTLS